MKLKRQQLFLKRILDKEKGDPVYQVYDNMTKYQYENNWAKSVVTLRERYDLPLNGIDQNIRNMSKFQWKKFGNERIRSFAFDFLLMRCQMNSKTKHLKYEKFVQASYLTCLSPQIARMIFRARLKMYDIKVNFKRMYRENTLCPFCRYCEETSTFFTVQRDFYVHLISGLHTKMILLTMHMILYLCLRLENIYLNTGNIEN